MVERCPDKTEVVGPIPTTPTVGRCALSSVVERLHDTQKVIGSIPVGRTNIKDKIKMELQALNNLRDDEILILSQEDPAYFSFLVDKYEDAFLRAARGITKNLEEAEDIVQETFVKIYKYAKNFEKRPGIEFKSWAYRILINTSITHYQKLKKERGNTEYLDPVLYEDNSFLSSNKDLGMEKDMKEGVANIIAKMPEHLARVLKLFYFEDKSYEDIARIERISMPALKMRIFRAKRVFKQLAEENI